MNQALQDASKILLVFWLWMPAGLVFDLTMFHVLVYASNRRRNHALRRP